MPLQSPVQERVEHRLEAPPAKTRRPAKRPRHEVAYWMFNYTPKWEAVSQEVELLSTSLQHRFHTRIISLDKRREKISFRGRHRHLPLPFGLFGLPMALHSTRGAAINHMFASPTAPLLPQLLAPRANTILTVAKDSPDLDRIEEHAEVLKSLRCVVVESVRDKDLMLQLGLAPERVKLIYPGVDLSPTKNPDGPFTILFATSPFQKNRLLSRGIHLMIEVAKLLPQVRFRFVWRTGAEQVEALIREAGVENIEVIAGYVPDMGAMYDSAHATILAALTHNSLKPCPHSGLHSLAHGKPVLVSHATSFAGIVKARGCGVVFDPSIGSLHAAIRLLMDHYAGFQANARSTSRECFSKTEFVERHQELYMQLLNGSA
jgi:glycosyltransferase involved in cell wall biosynthesis